MISIRLIVETVAEGYGVRAADIVSQRRTASVIWPRQVAMWLSRELTPCSLQVIGRHIGAREHGTVSHAIDVVRRTIDDNETLRAEVEALATAVEAVAVGRALLGKPIPTDFDVVAMARRLLATPGAASMISTDEVRALAAAVLHTADAMTEEEIIHG
ncbi:helix-turn-helix domain-containing protein [Segnochrobactrum spirostomi]|uniref:Chromosomal replication initiator DnaA C-terminal domain-containing protein n=1 Tax=Segnochrobactrum spirostomi TaxID=2608987 RepID=A0A6A7Y5D5_9HYPH|nr:helix-turn-helix domain-containing protein [Segnochrobactrum spirostomi]MQT14413.1 hypothetical protein [Segnochrobactrum spirostomi]